MNVRFLEELEVINFDRREVMGKNLLDQSFFDNVYQVIYQLMGSGLDTPVKKGVFLLGVLTQKLLDDQKKGMESMPFLKNLKSLKMNKEDILSLLPKVVNKLYEYDEYDLFSKFLHQEISSLLLKQDKFLLSNDEINFYFAAGMGLKGKVADVFRKSFPETNKEVKSNVSQ